MNVFQKKILRKYATIIYTFYNMEYGSVPIETVGQYNLKLQGLNHCTHMLQGRISNCLQCYIENTQQ